MPLIRKTRVYLAGASGEIEICTHWMCQLREKGLKVTHDWCDVIRKEGAANPLEATRKQREDWMMDDIEGIESCDVFWLLVPEGHSIGCWTELGIACQSGCEIIMSGSWRKTIFSALADITHDTHRAAFNYLVYR